VLNQQRNIKIIGFWLGKMKDCFSESKTKKTGKQNYERIFKNCPIKKLSGGKFSKLEGMIMLDGSVLRGPDLTVQTDRETVATLKGVKIFNAVNFTFSEETPIAALGNFIYRLQMTDLAVISTSPNKILVFIPCECTTNDLLKTIRTKECFLLKKGIKIITPL